METYKPTDTIVAEAARAPEVLRLCMKMITVQVANPSRFQPLPKFFLKEDKTLDITRFAAACHSYASLKFEDWKTDEEILQQVGTELYALLRFAVTSMPLQLRAVNLVFDGKPFEMTKVHHTPDIEHKFMQPGKAPSYLYHGSDLSNWHSITHNGIKVMSNTAFMSSGAVHGDGIYLSDSFTMSYNFCKNKDMKDFVLGVYEVYDGVRYQKTTNIFVVPNQDLLLLRYLIVSNGKPDTVKLGAAINQLLTQNSQAHAAASKKGTSARITKDLAALAPEYVHHCDGIEGVITTADGNKVFTANFAGYPLSPPKICLGDVQIPTPNWNIRKTVKILLDEFNESTRIKSD